MLLLIIMLISCMQSQEKAAHEVVNTQSSQQENRSLIEPMDAAEVAPDEVVKDEMISEGEGVAAIESSGTSINQNGRTGSGQSELQPVEVKVQDNVPDPEKDSQQVPVARADHAQWDRILKNYVSPMGQVDYRGLKAEGAALDQYLEHLAQLPPTDQFERSEVMAYWINVYNAFTVKLIMDNYPLGSIMELDNGKVWDRKWIQIGGKTYSLNAIEHDILRKDFKDARIHFAVNCAAKSCPPLANKAFTSENLESLLDKQASSFINSSHYNQISSSRASISKIFEWYASDFGDIIAYLNRYANVRLSPGSQITYNEYDWRLNGE